MLTPSKGKRTNLLPVPPYGPQGFRKYDRIRETLIHELAHMEYGEHDNDFKQLNSELRKECDAINAR